MSAVKSGSTLRSLVLTPERVPDFLIPSRSPLLFLSPRRPVDRTRLLSNPEDDSPGPSPSGTASRPGPEAPCRSRLHLPPPPRTRRPRRAPSSAADTDLTTHAAMSLTHVDKVTTPYGFRAVLSASPCTRRRESLFHRRPTVTPSEPQDSPPGPGPGPGPGRSPGPSRSWVSLRPVKALGLQVMKELKRTRPR